MKNKAQIILSLPATLCIAMLGCGPVEIGDGDRSIQVVLEDTGYKPFG